MIPAIPPSFSHDEDPIDPSLDDTSTTTSQGEELSDRFAKTVFFHDGLVKYMPKGYQQDAEGRMVPISSTHHPNQDKHEGQESDNRNEQDGPSPEHWKTLVPFYIPDYTQCDIASVPRLPALYLDYTRSYTRLMPSTNAMRMQYAKALAFTLLTHYYPTSQGYTVAPSPLTSIAKNGMNFIVAARDGSDIWHSLPAKPKSTSKKAKRREMTKRAPTRKERIKAEKAAKFREHNHDVAWMMNLDWYFIPPEDMAMFVVQRKRQVEDEATGVMIEIWCPWTYLAIMIDKFEQPPDFSSENMLHPSDILTDALCRTGNVQDGYGILLYGGRLGFFGFDAGLEYEPMETDYAEEDLVRFEPLMWLLEDEEGAMELDLRGTPWEGVDAAFKEVIGIDVLFRENPGR